MWVVQNSFWIYIYECQCRGTDGGRLFVRWPWDWSLFLKFDYIISVCVCVCVWTTCKQISYRTYQTRVKFKACALRTSIYRPVISWGKEAPLNLLDCLKCFSVGMCSMPFTYTNTPARWLSICRCGVPTKHRPQCRQSTLTEWTCYIANEDY